MSNEGPTASDGPSRPPYAVRRLEAAEKFEVVDRIERLHSINLSLTAWSEIARFTERGEEVEGGTAGRNDHEGIHNALHYYLALQIARPLLMISDDEGENLEVPSEVILRDRNGKNIALMHLTEKFRIDAGSLKPIAARHHELVPLITEYLLHDCGLAIAGDIEIVNVEKTKTPFPPVQKESERADERSAD